MCAPQNVKNRGAVKIDVPSTSCADPAVLECGHSRPHSSLSSFLASLLPCLLACLLACFLASLLPCFLASLLPCFLASLLPCFLPSFLPSLLACLLACLRGVHGSIKCTFEGVARPPSIQKTNRLMVATAKAAGCEARLPHPNILTVPSLSSSHSFRNLSMSKTVCPLCLSGQRDEK